MEPRQVLPGLATTETADSICTHHVVWSAQEPPKTDRRRQACKACWLCPFDPFRRALCAAVLHRAHTLTAAMASRRSPRSGGLAAVAWPSRAHTFRSTTRPIRTHSSTLHIHILRALTVVGLMEGCQGKEESTAHLTSHMTIPSHPFRPT